MLILGIDPGLVNTGWAIINFNNNKSIEFINGSIIKTKANQDIATRLAFIYDELSSKLKIYDIKHASIEQSLVNINAQSSIALAMARAVILLYYAKFGMTYKEYLPTYIKKSITGNGHADKDQIAKMINLYIKLDNKKISHHEYDAIAIALCYGFDHNNQLIK